MIKKKLSKKSKFHIKEISDQIQDLAVEKAVVDRELAAENEKALKLFENVGPWADLYSLSHHELVAYFYVYLGFQEKIIELARAEDKEEANMALFRELTDQEDGGDLFNLLDSFDEDKRSGFLSILLVMQGNMEGIKRYHETVSELVARADSDTEALMNAVAVDRSVVANPVIAKVISQAQLRQDESFMNLLAKSVTRTKPRRKPELDDSLCICIEI